MSSIYAKRDMRTKSKILWIEENNVKQPRYYISEILYKNLSADRKKTWRILPRNIINKII